MKTSFSRMSCFQDCPKKYYWKYVRNLLPRMEPKALRIGKEFHAGVAGEASETLWNKIGILAKQYFKTLPGEVPEVKTEFEIAPDLHLVCIADSVSDQYVTEYKTTGRPDANTYNALQLSLQHRLYAMAFSKPSVLLRVVTKSAIRQRKDENDEMFEARYLAEYADKPYDHFLEVEIPVTKPGAITELLMMNDLIKTCAAKNVWPMSAPYACYGFSPCPYLDLCRDEDTFLPMFEERTDHD